MAQEPTAGAPAGKLVIRNIGLLLTGDIEKPIAEGCDTLVKAVTELGGGFWVLTPLKTASGAIVLVNRGFVPADRRGDIGLPPGEVDRAAHHRQQHRQARSTLPDCCA